MNIVVKGRHMDVTDAIRQYALAKADKLPKYYDKIRSTEIILGMEGDRPVAEIVVQAKRKSTCMRASTSASIRSPSNCGVTRTRSATARRRPTVEGSITGASRPHARERGARRRVPRGRRREVCRSNSPVWRRGLQRAAPLGIP